MKFPPGYTIGYDSREGFYLAEILYKHDAVSGQPGYYVRWEGKGGTDWLTEAFVINCDIHYKDMVRQEKLNRILSSE